MRSNGALQIFQVRFYASLVTIPRLTCDPDSEYAAMMDPQLQPKGREKGYAVRIVCFAPLNNY